MTTLYLVRHGETAWNVGGRFQGQQNTPLSKVGRAQADAVARALADRHFAAIYTSDLTRSVETAAIVAAPHGMIPIPDARLREAHFGEWEGLSITEVTERWPEVVAAWRADSLRTRPPGGETLEAMQQRVSVFIEEVIRQYSAAGLCIIGHGGSLRAIVTHALGDNMTIFRRLRLDNCSISIVNVRNGQYSLMLFNDICHLGQQIPRATWDESGDQWRLAMNQEQPGAR